MSYSQVFLELLLGLLSRDADRLVGDSRRISVRDYVESFGSVLQFGGHRLTRVVNERVSEGLGVFPSPPHRLYDGT